jgi:hypothetical protein
VVGAVVVGAVVGGAVVGGAVVVVVFLAGSGAIDPALPAPTADATVDTATTATSDSAIALARLLPPRDTAIVVLPDRSRSVDASTKRQNIRSHSIFGNAS